MNKNELTGHIKIRKFLENSALFVANPHKWLINLTQWCINNSGEKNEVEVKLTSDGSIDCVECDCTDILYISCKIDTHPCKRMFGAPFHILFCLDCLRIIEAEYPAA